MEKGCGPATEVEGCIPHGDDPQSYSRSISTQDVLAWRHLRAGLKNLNRKISGASA